jgi:HAD superfamily hydrolase (TIGR01509 family)
MPPIDLVIFDCDGVLIDSEGLSARVLLSALSRLGAEVDFDYFCVNFVGRSFPTVARDIRDTFALFLPEGFERDYRRDLLAAFEKELTLTPGIARVLERLAVRSCVATSSSRERATTSLRVVGLTARFGADVFTASEVSRGKPAPDLFLHAAARMNTDPARCLVIEDSLPGVEAAESAGMQVLRYTGGAHLKGRVLKHGAGVRSFDNWDDFFLMMPGLGRAGDGNDDSGQERAKRQPAG